MGEGAYVWPNSTLCWLHSTVLLAFPPIGEGVYVWPHGTGVHVTVSYIVQYCWEKVPVCGLILGVSYIAQYCWRFPLGKGACVWPDTGC